MTVRKFPFATAALLLVASSIPAAAAREPDVLWRDPGPIQSRDLFYGPGGKRNQPPPGTFTFVKEDLKGTNPKLIVRDRNGVRWKVKLGIEARPETAASRIVWAAGYFADEDYFIERLRVEGLPPRLHRGQKFVTPDGFVSNARLKRQPPGTENEGTWSWRDDPFTGTRELNGLRVVMALINNWDLKDENNKIRDNGRERRYLVTDLGASFGTPGRSWPFHKERGDLESYSRAPLYRKISGSEVDFRAPGRPKFVFLVNPLEYIRHVHLEWVGHRIPREDARWIGRLLAQLSHRQVEDAFRAAKYSPQEVDGFSKALERRIAQLSDL